jgi:hypothetical protein
MTDDLHNDPIKKSAEEFSLVPSPRVWENVDRAINGKERKRRLIVFFFFGVFAAGIAGAWMIRIADNGQVVAQAEAANEEVNAPLPDGTGDVTANTDVQQQRAGTEDVLPLVSLPGNNSLHYEPQRTSHATSNENNLRAPSGRDDAGADSVKDNIVSLPVKGADELPLSATEVQDTLIADNGDHARATALPADTILVRRDSQLIVVPALDPEQTPAEENTPAHSVPDRLSFACGIAPAISFTRIEEIGKYTIREYRLNTDRIRPVLNAHLQINFAVVPRMELYSGLSITTFSNSIRSQQIVYRYDTGPVSGPTPPPVIVYEENYTIDPDKEYVSNHITYLGVPVGVRFNVVPRERLDLWIAAEAGINKLIHTRAYTYDDNHAMYRSMQKSDLQSSKMSYGFGLAAQWRMTNHLQLELNPVYRIYPGNIFSSGILIQKFSQLEFRMSLRYSFARL